MRKDKTSGDPLEQPLSDLRAASRVRARRLDLTGRVVAFLCLLLFLAVSLLAARETWASLDAPLFVLLCFVALAAGLQHILGLRVRGGRLRRARLHQPAWWALALTALACLVVMRLGGVF